MWLWLQNASPKVRIFILKIFALSLFVHFFVLSIFFLYKDEPLNLTIKENFNHLNVPIVFVPFKKTIPNGLKTFNKSIERNIAKINQNKVTIQKVAIKKKGINHNIKSEIKPVIIKKNEKKLQVKELKPKKIEKLKKEKVEEVKNKKDKVSESVNNNLKKVNEIKGENKIEPIYLGRNDLEVLELQNNVKQEIKKTWRPPTGISKNLECIVRINIDLNGKVMNLKIEKPSKSLIFDTSIKRDIAKLILPKDVWGKEILLTLNNS